MQPLDRLSHIPGGARVVEHATGNLAAGAAARVDDAHLPAAPAYQRRYGLPQIDLVRAAREPMQDHEHGFAVVRGHSPELLVGKVDCLSWQRLIRLFKRFDREVDCEDALVGRVVSVENLAAVEDRRAARLDRRPHGLQVTE